MLDRYVVGSRPMLYRYAVASTMYRLRSFEYARSDDEGSYDAEAPSRLSLTVAFVTPVRSSDGEPTVPS